MKKYYIIGLILSIVVLAQYQVVRICLGGSVFTFYSYQSENGDFQFVEIPQKGRNIAQMDRQVKDKIDRGQLAQNTIIYRTTKRNWLQFWNWYDYLTHHRWDYPYRNIDSGGKN